MDANRNIKDPNADGTAVGETLFEKVEKLRRHNPALKRRVSPYMVEGVRDEELSDLGSSVHSGEEVDDRSHDSEEDDFEILRKSNHVAGIGAIGVLVVLVAAIIVVAWWTISRNSEFEGAEPPPVETTPLGILVPVDLGPMFILKILLQGIAKDLFDYPEVRQAYLETLQKMPPLTRLRERERGGGWVGGERIEAVIQGGSICA